jgi:hypothetical protein
MTLKNMGFSVWHDCGSREMQNARAKPGKDVRTMAQDLVKNGKAGKSSTNWKPAIVPALALIAVGVLPPMLKGLYEQYTSQLMVAYVSFGMLFVAFVVGGLSLMVIRDLSNRSQKVWRLAPSKQTATQDDGTVPVKLESDRHRMNNETK